MGIARLAAAALALLVSGAEAEACTRSKCEPPPNFGADASLHQQAIRENVTGRAGFSKIVPPKSNRSKTLDPFEVGTTLTDAGTDVSLQIRFFKVQSIKAAEGWMQLKVWFRMRWVDERLSWNPSDFGGVTQTFFQGVAFPGAEENEIWVPDLQPYNAVDGIVHTLEPALATVQSDGTVYWTRPGSLNIMCKFSGLVAFPFDNLKCTLEIGGWIMSGGYQGINLLDGGYEYNAQEDTAGSTYQEYRIMKQNGVVISRANYEYPCCPSEPWPILKFTMTLERASFFYTWVSLIPGIVITMLSFAVFWADTASADALGFGISVIVVNLLSNIILIDMLPICGELIWIDMYAYMNTVFCCIALLQSAINIMLENFDGDYLSPVPVVVLSRLIYNWLRERAGYRNRKELYANDVIRESVAGLLYRAQMQGGDDGSGLAPPPQPILGSMAEDRTSTAAERARRLIFYEQLFFVLDADASLYIEREELEYLISYASLDLDPDRRQRLLNDYDTNSDHRLNRAEFVELCANTFWHIDLPVLEMAVANMQKARDARVTRNRARWRRFADLNDRYARTLIPLIYIFALIWVFNIDLRDDYTDPKVEMFQGLGPWTMPASGVRSFVIFGIICALIGASWVLVTRMARNQQKQVEADMKRKGADYVKEYTAMAASKQFRSAASVVGSVTSSSGMMCSGAVRRGVSMSVSVSGNYMPSFPRIGRSPSTSDPQGAPCERTSPPTKPVRTLSAARACDATTKVDANRVVALSAAELTIIEDKRDEASDGQV